MESQVKRAVIMCPQLEKTFRDTNPAPEAAPALSNTVPAAIRAATRERKTRDPPTSGRSFSTGSNAKSSSFGFAARFQYFSAASRFPAENKSKPENCWHTHLSDSSPKLAANRAWPQKIAFSRYAIPSQLDQKTRVARRLRSPSRKRGLRLFPALQMRQGQPAIKQ